MLWACRIVILDRRIRTRNAGNATNKIKPNRPYAKNMNKPITQHTVTTGRAHFFLFCQ